MISRDVLFPRLTSGFCNYLRVDTRLRVSALGNVNVRNVQNRSSVTCTQSFLISCGNQSYIRKPSLPKDLRLFIAKGLFKQRHPNFGFINTKGPTINDLASYVILYFSLSFFLRQGFTM